MLEFKVKYSINKKILKLRAVQRALSINALEIESTAKKEVNVRFGILQNSITTDSTKLEDDYIITVGSEVEYAAPQESIKPYLQTALDMQEEQLLKDIKNAAKKI